MLEGKEIDGKFDGDSGEYSVDVDDKGSVKVTVSYSKDVDGFAKVKTENSIETNVFDIAAKIAKQTAATWDDEAIATLKKLLGIS